MSSLYFARAGAWFLDDKIAIIKASHTPKSGRAPILLPALFY